MFKTKSNLFKLVTVLAILPLLGLGCKSTGTVAPESLKPANLTAWRVFDEPDDFTATIAAFRAQYPHINITVKKIRLEEYETTLLRALAEGTGPDIISLHNTWLRSYKDILAPTPDSITLPLTIVDGNKQTITLNTQTSLSLRDLRNNYVDAVVADAIMDGKVYGLPLNLDTLALYYNRTLLKRANLASAPATWSEFKEAVKALTAQDRNGNIVQAGAPLGTGRNINRGPDILAALMLQNGTEMLSADGTQAAFHLTPVALKERQIIPGRDALVFYTDFASPAKEVYTWNEKMPESLDAFTSGKSAFFFGYAYHLPQIKSLAPGLDLGITKLPQISNTAPARNLANYWLETVPKQSTHQNEAWAFIQFAAQAENVRPFLKRVQKPTALRALIAEQRQDDNLVTFADQVLTAESWYRGRDPKAAEEAMRTLIDQVVKGETTPEAALNLAAEKINATL